MGSFLFIRKDKTYLKLSFSDIVYLESVKRCVKVVTAKKTLLVFSTLCGMERKLPSDLFCRIHQSYIISLDYLEKFTCEVVYLANHQLPIGRGFREILLRKIDVLNCDPRSRKGIEANEISELIKKNQVK